MENEVRLIECRSCDARNCKGCNVYTLSKMLQRGEFDCMMDEHHSIVRTPETLRPKGRWIETYSYGCWHYDCSNCDDGYATNEQDQRKPNYCHNCGADMRGDGQ